MDETYIKMSKEAKEIQEGWEPKAGDLYLPKKEWELFLPESITYPMMDKDSLLYANFQKQLNEKGFLFVPRQEDLQTIYLTQLPEQTAYTLLFNLYRFKDCVDWIKYDLNHVWFLFVMETCYNKQWNGETWVEIE